MALVGDGYLDNGHPPAYVNGSQTVLFCYKHDLVYRPDTRIYPLGQIRCPAGGEVLTSFLQDFCGRPSAQEAVLDDDSIALLEDW